MEGQLPKPKQSPVTEDTYVDIDNFYALLISGKAIRLFTGGQADVFKVSSLDHDYAIKVYCDTITGFDRETEIFEKIKNKRHPHIVSYLGCSKPNMEYQFIVLEYAQCSLDALLHGRLPMRNHDDNEQQEKKYFIVNYSTEVALNWCRQISDAVAFLHELETKHKPGLKSVMHRDIKPLNVLMFHEFRTAKIADFGIATDDTIASTYCGTSRYNGPERSDGFQLQLSVRSEGYTKKADVWSIGAVFWEIFHREKFHKSFQYDMYPDYNAVFPHILYQPCFIRNPHLRPKIIEILNLFQYAAYDENVLRAGIQRVDIYNLSQKKGDTEAKKLPEIELTENDAILKAINCAKSILANVENCEQDINNQNIGDRILVIGGEGANKLVLSFSMSRKIWKTETLELPHTRYGGIALFISLSNNSAISKRPILQISTSKSFDADVYEKVKSRQRQLIGRDGFAKVYKVTIEGKEFAVIKYCKENHFADRMIGNYDLLSSFNHPYIVKVLCSSREFNLVLMELALCSLDDLLFKRVSQQVINYSVATGLIWCNQIARAIEFLHDYDPPIIHPDIKPRTVLMFENCQIAKLSGFSIMRLDDNNSRTNDVGTHGYMAPKIRKRYYDVQVDVYSFGVLFCEVLYRDHFKKHTLFVNTFLQKLCGPLLIDDPDQRPTIKIVQKQIEFLWNKFTQGAQLLPVVSFAEERLPPAGLDAFSTLFTNEDSILTSLESINSQNYQQKIVVFGGIDDETGEFITTADVLEFNTDSTILKQLPTSLSGRAYFDAVLVGDQSRVLIAGGIDKFRKELQSAELYLLSENKSDSVADMSECRASLAMAIDKTDPNRALATGGRSAQSINGLDSVEWFDMQKMGWLEGPKMTTARYAHAAACVNHRFFVCGGRYSKVIFEVLDPREGNWKRRKDLTYGRYGHRLLAVDNNYLYAIGGTAGKEIKTVEIFDQRRNEWIKGNVMPEGRQYFQAVVGQKL